MPSSISISFDFPVVEAALVAALLACLFLGIYVAKYGMDAYHTLDPDKKYSSGDVIPSKSAIQTARIGKWVVRLSIPGALVALGLLIRLYFKGLT